MEQDKVLTIKRQVLDDWLNSDLTKALLETLLEYKDATKDSITDEISKHISAKDIDLYKIAELRGNLQTFNTVLDIEEFVSFKIQLKEEVVDEKAHSQS